MCDPELAYLLQISIHKNDKKKKYKMFIIMKLFKIKIVIIKKKNLFIIKLFIIKLFIIKIIIYKLFLIK